MKKSSDAMERALDRVVFGTENAAAIKTKVDQMEKYLELEASSLGHSLAGIRHRHYWSLETMAQKAGVSVTVWKAWESDFETPTPDELKAVLERLHWGSDLERFLALRQKAPRVRLRRLTTMQPSMLAAQGVGGVSGTYEWQLLDDEIKERLYRWGKARDLVFPEALFHVLAQFDNDEERESWMDEVFDERGE